MQKVGTDRWAVRVCLNANPATLRHPCTPTGFIDHQPAARPAVTPPPQNTLAKVDFSKDVRIRLSKPGFPVNAGYPARRVAVTIAHPSRIPYPHRAEPIPTFEDSFSAEAVGNRAWDARLSQFIMPPIDD
jgi:hypothetical protein